MQNDSFLYYHIYSKDLDTLFCASWSESTLLAQLFSLIVVETLLYEKIWIPYFVPADLGLQCLLNFLFNCCRNFTVWMKHYHWLRFENQSAHTGQIQHWWQTGDILLFFPENRIWHFMEIVSRDNLHEMSNPILWEKQQKIFQMVSVEIITQHAKY